MEIAVSPFAILFPFLVTRYCVGPEEHEHGECLEHHTAKTNQWAAARPRYASVYLALVVRRSAETACTSPPSIGVCIYIPAAIPPDDPSCRAQLKIAPTALAADEGVEAKIVILVKESQWTDDRHETYFELLNTINQPTVRMIKAGKLSLSGMVVLPRL